MPENATIDSRSKLVSVKVEDIACDDNGNLRSGMLVGMSLAEITSIGFDVYARLTFKSKRYMIDLQSDGTFLASLDRR